MYKYKLTYLNDDWTIQEHEFEFKGFIDNKKNYMRNENIKKLIRNLLNLKFKPNQKNIEWKKIKIEPIIVE